MILEYNTINQNNNGGIVQKKSRFLSNLFHVENEEEVKKHLNSIKKKYYDAKHYIYAYIICNEDGIIEKYSDDGEPSGTGGNPILEMMKQKRLYNVLIIVTRYFGGILLGPGGLARAYTDSAKICIDNSQIDIMYLVSEVEIQIEYRKIDELKYFCQNNDIKIGDIEYLDKIVVNLQIKHDEYKNKIKLVNNMLDKNVEILNETKKYIKK